MRKHEMFYLSMKEYEFFKIGVLVTYDDDEKYEAERIKFQHIENGQWVNRLDDITNGQIMLKNTEIACVHLCGYIELLDDEDFIILAERASDMLHIPIFYLNDPIF